ncbi:hypothetical protein [Actinoplanes sp. NPDC051494]|uniref:hypothetical protein n=1 Tax=Actinoplanes sp. NPDC051494 TaxID=3363907 RepID=UPI0037AE209F
MSEVTEADLVARILSAVDRINAKAAELQEAVTARTHLLPTALRDAVVAGWNDFCARLTAIGDVWYDLVTHLGSPTALIATADRWSDLVGAPVSGKVQAADAGLLDVDDHWDGAAADAYRQTLPVQRSALENVTKVLVDGITMALADVAKGIYLFWGILVGALLTFVVGLITALASASTVFGLPAAPFIAAGAAGLASGMVVGAGLNLEATCAAASTALRRSLADNTGFSDGHWPPAVRA